MKCVGYCIFDERENVYVRINPRLALSNRSLQWTNITWTNMTWTNISLYTIPMTTDTTEGSVLISNPLLFLAYILGM